MLIITSFRKNMIN